MFRDLPRYAETRGTGLPWATSVPSHWRVERAKSIMRPVDIRSATGAEELLTVSSSRGVVPRSTADVSMFKAKTYVGHKLCWPDDLVINSLWAWGRGLGVARHHGIVSSAYGVYRQRDAVLDPDFLQHLVRSEPYQWELQVRSQGVWKSRLQMTDARWLDGPLLVPPADEQAAIVKYLAHANARIDKAITAKRRLIALLDEEVNSIRAGLLNGAVGVSARLKNFATIQTGLTLGKDYGSQRLAKYPYLRVANVQMGRVDTADIAQVAVPQREAERSLLRSGDVLVTEGGDIDKLGRGTVWDGHIQPCLHQNHVFAVQCVNGLQPDYLSAWLSGPVARDYFYRTAKRTTNLASTNSTTLAEMPLTVPAAEEQRRILRSIEIETAAIISALSKTEREIWLLQEFRSRLVADVVTGQVDVRTVAAKLPDAPQTAIDLADEASEELSAVVEGADA